MPPGGPLTEEEEYDIGTVTANGGAAHSHPEKYHSVELQGIENEAIINSQHDDITHHSSNINCRESLQAAVTTGDGACNNGGGNDHDNNNNSLSSIFSTSEKSKKKWASIHKHLIHTKKTATSLFIKYWFLLGLGFVIGMAWLFPNVGKTNGIIQAQYTVKWGAVILIFLLSGLGIDVRIMFKTFLQWRLHLVIQVINFIVMPFLMYGIVLMFIKANAKIDTAVYKGWMIAMSTSTTVSSNVVMTRNAKGNDSGALFNAAFGNLLGIFICPALMTVFQQDPRVFPPGTPHGNPNYVNIFRTLGFTVLLPLVIGQIIRFIFSEPVKKLAAKLRFPIINNVALLFLVWSVFCDGVASDAFNQMTAVDIVSIIFVDIFMYVFACLLCIYVARVPWPPFLSKPKRLDQWRFEKQDTVAIMYCGATKTVSMGIPLINVLYAESSYGVVGVLSLPLLLYHIIQLFIGNFQVQILKNWINKDQ
ncbi:SBF-like CPA transporter family-domain-containing protein, partial [Phascolomyces articulosus]